MQLLDFYCRAKLNKNVLFAWYAPFNVGKFFLHLNHCLSKWGAAWLRQPLIRRSRKRGRIFIFRTSHGRIPAFDLTSENQTADISFLHNQAPCVKNPAKSTHCSSLQLENYLQKVNVSVENHGLHQKLQRYEAKGRKTNTPTKFSSPTRGEVRQIQARAALFNQTFQSHKPKRREESFSGLTPLRRTSADSDSAVYIKKTV